MADEPLAKNDTIRQWGPSHAAHPCAVSNTNGHNK